MKSIGMKKSKKQQNWAKLWGLFLISLALASCTHIEQVNVLTNAMGCDVTRGEDTQAGGDAQANVLQQAGAAGASFAGSLRSIIVCPGGFQSAGEVQGKSAEAQTTDSP